MAAVLTIDPIPGGNENSFVYPGDPIANFDLDGKIGSGPCTGPAYSAKVGETYVCGGSTYVKQRSNAHFTWFGLAGLLSDGAACAAGAATGGLTGLFLFPTWPVGGPLTGGAVGCSLGFVGNHFANVDGNRPGG